MKLFLAGLPGLITACLLSVFLSWAFSLDKLTSFLLGIVAGIMLTHISILIFKDDSYD